MTTTDVFLEHYGVKGMKWGVRKAASTVGSVAAKAATGASNGVKDAVRRSQENRAATKAERKENFEKAREAGYSRSMREQDYADVGKRGVRKIERRIANGERIGPARFKVQIATTARGFAVGTAILATPVALMALDRGAGNLAANINAKRGAEAARKIFADNKGLTSYKTVGMAYDSVTGVFRATDN